MKEQRSSLGRRDFLRLGGAGALGTALAASGFAAAPRSLIVIWQAGGASHLDTFDMKPGAPRSIRGEFRPIATSAPGVEICEHLPRTAKLAHRFAIVRSMRSDETNHERARRCFELGMPVGGDGSLAGQCARACREVAAGAKFVPVWQHGYDTHVANFVRLRDRVLPEFDWAFSGLLLDLERRGLADTTLVVVMSEFGRSPRINEHGGRDHHSRAWSVLLAGAGIAGGRVIGATDETGSEVIESPVGPEDLLRNITEIVPAHRA